jgi:CheY-like chemotaxis protein
VHVAAAKRAIERVQPAAVLLDVVLCGDEFWRMILGLRQDEATGNIPIVVTSASGIVISGGIDGFNLAE